jgi:hypothetical protein
MRHTAYDPKAAKQTIARRKAEQIKAEIQRDLEALDAYEAKHGSFAEMVREHYRLAGDEPK